MYIHIGGEYVVSDRLIIGVFDLNSVYSYQTDMKRFMSGEEKSGRMEYIGTEIPQSLIVTMERSYVSPLSAHTLLQRMSGNGSLLTRAQQQPM
ncbi:MAG: DUF370 domain-containing protein [Clostridiaceae bacterium]|nr:DUF370 domain-containing protein [Oscillospiraceae bacterium]NLO62253.1 DUF370 domain-containing protein [Clostridiaceae bacterium]